MNMQGATSRPAPVDRTGRTVVVLLLLLTLLALGLRLYRLDNQSLWYDEGFSVYLSGMDLSEITARTAVDIQPPLYYYLLHGWMLLFGDSEWAVRAMSVLFSVFSVPLIYLLAQTLFRSRLAGLLSALLLSISPLHIWYGQETRMYSLLVFLCLLSSYLLLLAVSARTRQEIAAFWAAYALVSVAALYTHYFAFFVLLLHAFYVLALLVAQQFRPLRLLLGSAAAGAAILLLYLPWLPHLLTRYAADASYWPGQLKIHEVLVDIAILFAGGESVTEPVGIALSIGLGLVLLLSLVALLSWAGHADRPAGDAAQRSLPASYFPLLFLLLYLMLPPALILAVSYNTPKFNARYAMVSHPALLLLVAGGMAALWQRRAGTMSNVLRGALSSLALMLLLAASAYASYNIYADPAFARADFRSVAWYVRERIGPDETIILTSGHMFPVWDYYAPGLERHLLPDSPTLDTGLVLDYTIAADLNQWLADKRGVWVVLWQDEVVDPTGVLITMLDQVGDEQPVDQSFPQVGLCHYRLPEGAALPEEPTIAHPADYVFGNELRLLGYTQTGDQEVVLFWEALRPLDEDYRVWLTLRDTVGQVWGQWDGRPAAYLFPTNRWRVGQIVFGLYKLVPLAGAPPGDYGLEVGVYTEEDLVGLDVLDAAGAPQGKRAMLGAVRLSVPAVEASEIDVPNPGRVEMGGGLALLGWDLDRVEAQPGDPLLLTLIWAVESVPQGDYQVRVVLTDEAGQSLSAGNYPPTNLWHPTAIWLPGQAWRGQTTFRLPVHAQPGQAGLAVQLLDANDNPLGTAAELGSIAVLPTDRVFTAPQPEATRRANYGDRVLLVGADLAPDPASPGAVVQITLYWQALADMDIGYSVFVHVLGVDGQVIVGHDGEPVQGTRPTTGWVPGEYIADRHDLSLPADLPAGEYVIEVGMYDAGAPRMPRLPVLGNEGQEATDRVIFGPVQVR